MSAARRRLSRCLPSVLLCTLFTGCAGAPLAQYPEFPKTKATMGPLAVMADVTPLHQGSGDIRILDVGHQGAAR
jgi:hypothetical protein